MATAGQINTNTTYDSFFWVYWSQQSQDIAANKTTIYWSCGVTCGHSFYSNAITMSPVSINGQQVYGGGTYSNFSVGEHRIAYGYLDITHGSNGEKSFSVGPFTGWLYSNNHYSSDGGSFSLTAIPRKATITAASDFTDLKGPSVTYSNPAGEAVSELHLYIYDTDDKTILAGPWDLPKTQSSASLELKEPEINTLRNLATGSGKKVWFYIKTVIGGGTYWSSKYERTFSVEKTEDSVPTVTMHTALNNSLLPDGFEGLDRQGKARLEVSLSAEGKYSASIESYSAQIDGKTYSGEEIISDAFQNAGHLTVVGSATDSRGFTATVEQGVDVIAYAKPLLVPIGTETALQCYRSDSDGKKVGNSTSVFVKAARSYSPVMSEGEQKNFCALQCRKKSADREWDDNVHKWTDLLTKDGTKSEYSGLLPGEVFAPEEAYTVQLRVTDDIGETDVRTFEVPTQDVALHLGYGSKNVSVGAYCDYEEEYTFRSAWNSRFDRDLTVNGAFTAAGGVNGAYMATVRVWGTKVFRIKSEYSAWDEGGNRQSFLLCGSMDGAAVLGVIVLNSGGGVSWSGTENVTVATEEGGVVAVTLSVAVYDHFLIQSPKPFSVL